MLSVLLLRRQWNIEGTGDELDEEWYSPVSQRIDVATETIELAGTSSVDAAGLANAISDTEPRYSFLRYSTSVGESPVVFIYTCPPSSKIKERMLYASSKLIFVQAVETEVGLCVVKRVGVKF